MLVMAFGWGFPFVRPPPCAFMRDMSSEADPTATPALDAAAHLPAENQRSYVAMLSVQALNAFNDNFVKILLVAFAGVVAKGTDVGGSMQLYLGAIFSVPYILFAPVAGWLSDRCSKQRVIFWMQVVQVIIFVIFLGALSLHQTLPTLWASLGCFFLLATQAAFFSPAKYGIMKELVGSRRLGSASGMLQLTNFVGILGGMGLAGAWFAFTISKQSNAVETLEKFRPFTAISPLIGQTWEQMHAYATSQLHEASWNSVELLLVVVTVVALAQIVGSLFIHRTPDHAGLRFHRGVWVEHFAHLKLLFSQRPLMLAALGVTYFWFMSNAVGGILVTLAHEMHPTDESAAARALSMMPAMLGIGIMLGSVTAGFVCRKRIELGLVPLSGYALAASLLWSGLAPISPWIYMALVGVGMAAGAFMTPLYAFVQDRAKPEERARILSAMNLMDCVGGIIANIVLVKGMLAFHIPSWVQLLVIVPFTLGAALFITKLLPRPLMMLIVNAVVRLLYRIKVHHPDRMPKQGAVLLLPNHVSYADALVLGVSTDRRVRFVMVDSLYKIRSIHWFLKLFGTVPISATKAKEAVRTVGGALDEGGVVVLFPEGQLTRTGFFNELHKGYELMARNAEHPVKVQPVWLDGLWGSLFSYEGGRFFRKMPRAWPYRIGVWFGEPMDAGDGTAEKVREAMMALSAEAFLSRDAVRRAPKLTLPGGPALEEDAARIARVNALRVLETSLLHEGDVVLCLLPPEHAIARTFGVALPQLRGITVCSNIEDLLDALVRAKSDERRIVLIGDISTLTDERLKVAERPYTVTVQFHSTAALGDVHAAVANACPALYDEASGVLLTLSVPDPALPEKERGHQLGRKPGTLGHVLPGLAVHVQEGGLLFSRLLPETDASIQLPGVTLDDEGFVVPGV
jgi:acyl-[acyl-carrier-protein]-phospholipid O-acyltransferase/long-chain-fatty-acid--[acyl-carrier-protein] ligase